MELIDRSQFAEKIIAIGIEELNKVASNSKYKMDFNIEVINASHDVPSFGFIVNGNNKSAFVINAKI